MLQKDGRDLWADDMAGTANYAGWVVDAAIVEAVTPVAVPQPDDHLQIQALIAERDSDGYLNRLAY